MLELLMLVSLAPGVARDGAADVSIYGPYPDLPIMTARTATVKPCVFPNRCGSGDSGN